MALKAGRVGVAPEEVDVFGKIKGGGSSGSYTKEESDAKYRTKADSYTKEDVYSKEQADVKFAGKSGIIVPTVNNDLYISVADGADPYLHDDGDDVTTFVFDCNNNIGRILDIGIQCNSSLLTRYMIGCVDSVEEGALVDLTYRFDNITTTGQASAKTVITKRYVVFYVKNGKMTEGTYFAQGLIV